MKKKKCANSSVFQHRFLLEVNPYNKVYTCSQSKLNNCVSLRWGPRSGAVGWGTTLPAGRSRVRFEIFRGPHHDIEVDSTSNRNENQEYLLRGKDGRYVGLTTLAPSCADCLEIWDPHPTGTLNRDCFTRFFRRIYVPTPLIFLLQSYNEEFLHPPKFFRI
jgi:hypothetical protein